MKSTRVSSRLALPPPPWGRLGWALGFAGPLGLALKARSCGPRRRLLAPVPAILLRGMLALAACGGGGGGSNTQLSQTIPGTPPQNSLITLTGASGSISHTLTAGLNVEEP